MEKIHGLIDAPFTPFYENGEVNYEPIEAYCQLLVRNGLQGVFINGSSGEGYMLTEDERMKLAERWMEVAPEGFKVIVHVGSTCVKSSKRLAEHAQKIGAWGIGAMAPPFPKVGRIEELVKYCEEIACGAPALPFYFYHIPAFIPSAETRCWRWWRRARRAPEFPSARPPRLWRSIPCARTSSTAADLMTCA